MQPSAPAEPAVRHRTVALPPSHRVKVDQALDGGEPVTLDIRMEVWGIDAEGRALLCFVDQQGQVKRLGSARLSAGRRAEILVAKALDCHVELHLEMMVVGRSGNRYHVTIAQPEGRLAVGPRTQSTKPHLT